MNLYYLIAEQMKLKEEELAVAQNIALEIKAELNLNPHWKLHEIVSELPRLEVFRNNINELYFSQSSISIYERCPLKFRRRYLDGLFWPQNWLGNDEQKELIEKGKLFHTFAERYYKKGMFSSEQFIPEELETWLQHLRKFRPYNERYVFYPEYELRISRDDIKLMVKYDLLYIDKSQNKVVIYDWKTNKKALSSKNYKKNYQTIVYLYVLQEALFQTLFLLIWKQLILAFITGILVFLLI